MVDHRTTAFVMTEKKHQQEADALIYLQNRLSCSSSHEEQEYST